LNGGRHFRTGKASGTLLETGRFDWRRFLTGKASGTLLETGRFDWRRFLTE
jgi:hypothetical protein